MASKKPAAAPEIKKEEPLPIVNPSSFAQLEPSKQPFILFDKYTASFYNSLQQQKFNQDIQLGGEPIMSMVDKVAEAFDSVEIGELLTNPPELIVELAQLVNSKTDSRHYRSIGLIWPPKLPQGEDDVIPFFLAAVLHTAKRQENVLTWLSKGVFKPTFTQQKPRYLALCRCKKDGKKNGYWAVLDTEKNFKFFFFKKNDVQLESQGKVEAITIGKDKLTVQITVNKKIIAKFVPEDALQVPIWEKALTQQFPMVKMITSFKTPAIDEIYKLGYDVIANADALVLKAIASQNQIKPNSPQAKKIIGAFITIFQYARKLPALLSAVLVNDFDGKPDLTAVIRGSTYTKEVFDKLIAENSAGYTKDFLARLAEFIDENGGCGIGTDNVDVAGVEKLVINVVKFICSSFNIISPQIVYLLSFLRSYILLKSNKVIDVYNAIAQYFLLDFVCAKLGNVKAIYPKVKHPEIFKPISRLLYVIFSLGEIDGEFEKLSSIQSRLEGHTYNLLIEFSVQISKLPTVQVDFPPPSPKLLSRAIEAVLSAMSTNLNIFQKTYDAKMNEPGQSLIGSNYAALLTSVFIHKCDTSEVAKEQPTQQGKKRRVKLVRAKDEDLEGKVVHKVVPLDKTSGVEPSGKKKYYKRVTKRVPRNED